MFHVAGDVSFWAEEAGATSVSLFDGMDPSPAFQAKHAERGSAVHYQQADLHDPEDVAIAGVHDVVWCTGVIYHSPSPFQQLLHLRELTRERLVLGTHVIPEIPGIEGGCVFYAGRSAASEAAFAHAHGFRAGGGHHAERASWDAALRGLRDRGGGSLQPLPDGCGRTAGRAARSHSAARVLA